MARAAGSEIPSKRRIQERRDGRALVGIPAQLRGPRVARLEHLGHAQQKAATTAGIRAWKCSASKFL